ncbi:MAG: prepilin-type N-terminal cleavage/methylation domain-containing protein [Planctomycetes bacterium]|nr:prepilin-type N-terminal cleavage/methylation domain-containing protein [Planctomycetota bacterium]MBL7145996.1 prepilin-type N-terminal cleavage/methylation domain-containing protein [Phycisphaerae bacterium]
MKRKGFTLVELLVVIAIIALLMGILMPALSRVRQIAFRMVCGTNLSGIGKAMLIYANDYEDEFPRAGGRNSKWGGTLGGANGWMQDNRFAAYGLGANGSGGQATITSSFYLLVKYAEVTPKSFICKGDSGTTEFKQSDYPAAAGLDLIDLWDFGPESINHCSYSYHLPYGLYALTTSSEPGMAVAADRNPWMKSPAAEAKTQDLLTSYNPDGGKEYTNVGNAIAHQEDGQNVLFMDSHVNFEKQPFCAINDDNIYTYWDGGDIRRGGYPRANVSEPTDRLDSFLVHDGEGGKGRCFPADTPVWINGELVQISKVIVGRTVGCLSTVRHIEKLEEHHGSFVCRDITLENGNRISVVDAHRFMLDSGKWVAAPNLESGMKLKSLKGAIAIKSVVKRPLPFVGKVYNLKVAGSEQYFVGKDGVIVRDW